MPYIPGQDHGYFIQMAALKNLMLIMTVNPFQRAFIKIYRFKKRMLKTKWKFNNFKIIKAVEPQPPLLIYVITKS